MIKYSVKEFIDLTRSEPHRWIHYCEIIILYNGMILLARPSHQECIINYAMEVESNTREEILKELYPYYSPDGFYIDKYHLIAVWYDYLYLSDSQMLNRFQVHTLKELSKAGLIDIRNIGYTREYRSYLEERKV